MAEGDDGGGRQRLDRARVLAGAMAVADAGGIDALTIRSLGQHLGVKPMSVYYYVANKDEILDGIVDLVVEEIDLPSDEPDWKAAIRRSAISNRDVLLRHRWASSLRMARQSGGPAQLRHADWTLKMLREAEIGRASCRERV